MQDVKSERNRYIGGSDIPIIMGISPFKTRFDLLLEKCELKETEEVDNEFTRYGNELEPKIREYINKNYGRQYVEDKLIDGDVRCHYDGIDNGGILEIKTTSKIHDNVNEYKIYLVQLLFYMQYANKEQGVLAVYERPSDFNINFDNDRLHIYDININDYKELIEDINTAVNLFRYDITRLKANPMLSEEDLLPVNIRELSNTIIALEDQLKGFKQLQEKQEEMKEKLRQEMNKVCIKKWTMPNGTTINNVEDGEDKEITKFNEIKFREENEELYKKYCETKTQKGRKGYLKINEK